jgi:primary-amine oxidase
LSLSSVKQVLPFIYPIPAVITQPSNMAAATTRLKSVASQLTPSHVPHPFDPLSGAEIEHAVAIVRKEKGELFFNAVSLKEPRKKEMLAWLADPKTAKKPARIADVVALAAGSKVYDGYVDLDEGKLVGWELLDGFQPLVSAPRIYDGRVGADDGL